MFSASPQSEELGLPQGGGRRMTAVIHGRLLAPRGQKPRTDRVAVHL